MPETCVLCASKEHNVEDCPQLSIAKAAVTPDPAEKCKVVELNQPPKHWAYRVEVVPKPGNRYDIMLRHANGDLDPVSLWTGHPGICSRSEQVQTQDSVSMDITYGTALAVTTGGPGNYSIVHDASQRQPVIKVSEVDGTAEVTDLYIEVEKKSSTVGLGWIEDFRAFE